MRFSHVRLNTLNIIACRVSHLFCEVFVKKKLHYLLCKKFYGVLNTRNSSDS
jgi:hypothetical protein